MEMDDGERKRKRRKIAVDEPVAPSRWGTESEQQIYSSRLLHALRRVRQPAAAAPRTRTVREAADRALAFSARGRTRWSRAILLSSRRAAARLKTAARRRLPKPPVPPKPPAPAALTVPPLQRKARVLGSLVPGCRKLPLPALLDETSDYIAALQMQVRAMTALADALSAVGGVVPGSSVSGIPPALGDRPGSPPPS